MTRHPSTQLEMARVVLNILASMLAGLALGLLCVI
jgi:hypothetical protein